MIKFPHEESGKNRKLSRPWHGPWRIITMTDIDVTAIRIYFPEDGSIKVNQGRVTKCPMGCPTGCYWYGNKKQWPGHLPRWLKVLCEEQISEERSEQYSSQIVRGSKKNNQFTESTKERSTSKNASVKTKKSWTREIVPPARYRNQLRNTDDGGVM